MAPSAQTKMKALVVSRLMMGHFETWSVFQRELDTARKITNRRIARRVSSQIGRGYRELSAETKAFIAKNFDRCDYNNMARLCDAVTPGIGLYLRLDEFEKSFFPLTESVKQHVPFYAHVSISTYGLQFEFPEHHFMCDLRAGFEDLKETRIRIDALPAIDANKKEIARLVGREKFISRSVVSAAFSLVEAFLSGLFFTALHLNAFGNLRCDEEFLKYAKSKEMDALKDRVDRVVKFASQGKASGTTDPFKSLMEVKHFRDAIHHTTPFERKNFEAGRRLEALYAVNCEVAVACSLTALGTVLKITAWLYGEDDRSAITLTCKTLSEEIFAYSVEQGIAKPVDPIVSESRTS